MPLPSLARICQLSAIKADYWLPLVPPPSSARRSEGARPSERSTYSSDAGRRPESENGLGFSIGADPSNRRPIENPWPSCPARPRVRRSGGMASNRRRRTSEGGPLRSSTPLVARLGAEFARGRRLPDSGNHLPRPSIGLGGPIRTGIGGRRLGESCSPSSFPPFPVLVRSSSAFPPMSCLEIRVGEPEFLNPHPRPARLRFDWGFFRPPQTLPTAEESPLRRFPPYPAFLRGRHRRLHRFKDRRRRVPRGSPSAPGPMEC